MKRCQQPCAADMNGNRKVLFIEELNKKLHDRKTFDCGLADVNEFLKKRASLQALQSINRTWVALDDEMVDRHPAPIVGFYTLTSCTVAHTDIQGNYPHYPLPAFKLAWFGVHTEYQGTTMRVGEELLVEALIQSWELFTHTQLGVALVVDPLTRKSEDFFRKYDFQEIGRSFHGQETLYLPMKKIRQMIEADLLLGAQEKFGSRTKAERWLDTPAPLFGGLMPRKMIDVVGGVGTLEDAIYES